MNDTRQEPDLEVAPSWKDPPGMAKTMGTACAVGGVLSLAGVTVGMHLIGSEWGAAIGLGIFVAFWGGLGFGAMIGGVLYATSLEASGELLASAPKVLVEAEGFDATDDLPGVRPDRSASTIHTSPAA